MPVIAKVWSIARQVRFAFLILFLEVLLAAKTQGSLLYELLSSPSYYSCVSVPRESIEY